MHCWLRGQLPRWLDISPCAFAARVHMDDYYYPRYLAKQSRQIYMYIYYIYKLLHAKKQSQRRQVPVHIKRVATTYVVAAFVLYVKKQAVLYR